MSKSPLTPDQAAARIASKQYGLLRHTDVTACGLSDRQIENRLAAGRWQPVVRGVYRIAGAPRSWRQDALVACLAPRQSGVISHLTAAALHGWGPPPVLPHVTVAPSASARTRLARVHRSRIELLDRMRVDGIPCTTPSRTIVDCAGLVERSRLESMVDDALCAGVAATESVLSALDRAGRGGRRGATLLVCVLDVWTEAIRPGSPAEVRFVRRLEEWGCDGTVTQHEVRDERGCLVARLDVAIPSRRHGFEYDSDRFHNPRHWTVEEQREARLRALGWRIDHVSKLDLLPSSARLPDLLARLAA